MSGIERVSLEPAYLLHSRAYRESSEIIEALTRHHGRVSLVARGLRGSRSALRSVLQPFRPIAVSWAGRGGGLVSLTSAEPAGAGARLQGSALMAAYYATELILRFLHKGDPHPQVFDGYSEVITELTARTPPERPLRRFELRLLADIGYGLNLEHDAISGEPIDPQGRYLYVAEQGAMLAGDEVDVAVTYSGTELQAIARGDFPDRATLAGAKRLLRAVLDHHLAGRPLRTRQVFSAMLR